MIQATQVHCPEFHRSPGYVSIYCGQPYQKPLKHLKQLCQPESYCQLPWLGH